MISQNKTFFVNSSSLKNAFSIKQMKTMHVDDNSSSNKTQINIKKRNDMMNISNFQKQNFLKNFTIFDEFDNIKNINSTETHDDMKNVKTIIESTDQLIQNNDQQLYVFEMIQKSLNKNNKLESNMYLQLYMNICIMN